MGPHVIEDECEWSAGPDTLVGRNLVADVVAIGTSTRAVRVQRNVNAIDESSNTDEAAAWSAPHFDDIHLG